MAKIQALENGPYLITLEQGEKLYVNGSKTPSENTKIALCRCGNSKTKPMCDGSHQQGERFLANVTSLTIVQEGEDEAQG